DVAEFVKLSAPARFAGGADLVVENFERHLLLSRITLARHVSPLATGNDRLLKMRETVEESLEPLLAADKGAALTRYLELGETAHQELLNAIDQNAALRFGPSSFFSGVEVDLQEICVITRR